MDLVKQSVSKPNEKGFFMNGIAKEATKPGELE